MLSASYLLCLRTTTLSSPLRWRLWGTLPATGTWVMLTDQRTLVNSLWGVAVQILTNCEKTLSKITSAAHISILTGKQWLLRWYFNTGLPSGVLKPIVLTLHELFSSKGLLMWMLEGHTHQKTRLLLILDMNFRSYLGNADRSPYYVAVRDIKKTPKSTSLACNAPHFPFFLPAVYII